MRRTPMAWWDMQFRNADCGLLFRQLECWRGELYSCQPAEALPAVAATIVKHRNQWQEETRTGDTT